MDPIDLGRGPPPPAADNVFVVNQSNQSVAQPLSCSAKITGIQCDKKCGIFPIMGILIFVNKNAIKSKFRENSP